VSADRTCIERWAVIDGAQLEALRNYGRVITGASKFNADTPG
jgi:hypothetical protein